jgi:hypothetical protein
MNDLTGREGRRCPSTPAAAFITANLIRMGSTRDRARSGDVRSVLLQSGERSHSHVRPAAVMPIPAASGSTTTLRSPGFQVHPDANGRALSPGCSEWWVDVREPSCCRFDTPTTKGGRAAIRIRRARQGSTSAGSARAPKTRESPGHLSHRSRPSQAQCGLVRSDQNGRATARSQAPPTRRRLDPTRGR